MLLKTVQQAKRFFKILMGFTLLLAGGIMLVTPGPGWLTIVLGLAVLAAEFVWARRLLDRLKAQGIRLRETVLPNAKRDRKSTRLNSSHGYTSYAVFCLKKKER